MFVENWWTSNEPSDGAIYLRKEFSVKKCKKATLETTALGWLKIFINGKAVSSEEFLPGWTDYNKRVPLLRYDITRFLREKNAIGAIVGKGWAAGSACWGNFKKYYDVKTPCFYAKIVWTDEDGKKHTIRNAGWKFGYGRIVENDLMYGETQDYFRDCEGFDRVGFDDSSLRDARLYKRRTQAVKNVSPTVSCHENFKGKEIASGERSKLFDFGQNFAGIAKVKVRVKEKAELTVRHGEMLDRTGNLYTENLRTAKATDRYILKAGEYELRPYFTYHGFRYAELTWTGEMEVLECEGVAIYFNGVKVGNFETSDPLVDKIAKNCLWAQKSNFLYVPTDCPQRDERLGWLGDAGIFARSAMYQMDCRKFFEHYLSVIAEATGEDGAIPCIAPIPKGFLENAIGASGWADAFLTILSDHYDFYADKKVVETYFPYAERFVSWVEANSTDYRRNTYCFSDWLSIHADLKEGCGDVDFNVFDTCYYALDCLLMKKFCRILGREERVYEEKHKRAKRYFEAELCKNGVPIGGGRQTALLLAYKAGLLTGEEIENGLVSDLKENGLTCGFIGVKYLLPVLTELGRSDLAYALIASEEYPSWGYSIVNGATTTWERWDSYTKENGFHSSGMNSFNHFAFGSCAEWFYSDVLGIKLGCGEVDGIRISPTIDFSGKITWVKGSFQSRFGKIGVAWRVNGDTASVCVNVSKEVFCEYDFKDCEIVDFRRNGDIAEFSLRLRTDGE